MQDERVKEGREERDKLQQQPVGRCLIQNQTLVLYLFLAALLLVRVSGVPIDLIVKLLPSRFRFDSNSNNDGAISTGCEFNEPESFGAEIIF